MHRVHRLGEAAGRVEVGRGRLAPEHVGGFGVIDAEEADFGVGDALRALGDEYLARLPRTLFVDEDDDADGR